MIITYEQLITYASYASAWLSREENKSTKLAYAIERFGKKYPKYIQAYQDLLDDRQSQINDAYTDFASEDAEKNIMRLIVKDDNGKVTYSENKYTRENKKACDEKIRTINREFNQKANDFLRQEVEIESYYSASIPENLTNQELEAFTGIVIEPIKISVNGQQTLQEASWQ